MQQLVRSLIVAFWPDGGQGTARRNAWAAMAADTKRARERETVEATVRSAAAAHQALVAPVAVNG